MAYNVIMNEEAWEAYGGAFPDEILLTLKFDPDAGEPRPERLYVSAAAGAPWVSMARVRCENCKASTPLSEQGLLYDCKFFGKLMRRGDFCSYAKPKGAELGKRHD